MAQCRTALVYSGEGAGHRSVLSTIESLEDCLNGVKVRQLHTEELLEGGWRSGCLVLCMPGGADLPYCKLLDGKGNALIRGFVEAGGSYLGLCAGGYYACASIEFELGTKLEVRGERELAFFPGLARGAVYPGFAYQTEAGTAAAPLRFKDGDQWLDCRDYSNGGPAFVQEHANGNSNGVTELATYEDDLGTAAVRCQVGEGVAVLCGTHPELEPRWLDAACNPANVREAHPRLSKEKVEALVKHAKAVRSYLTEDQGRRRQLWRSLLCEAGLRPHLKQSD